MQKVFVTTAELIYQGFCSYHDRFKEITTRAKLRFERRDWHSMYGDAVARLGLYSFFVTQTVAALTADLGDRVFDKRVWAEMKRDYLHLVARSDDVELAETFFNSITRRIFATVGVDPRIEFVDPDFAAPLTEEGQRIFKTYRHNGSVRQVLAEVFAGYSFRTPYKDLQGDLDLAARVVESHIEQAWGAPATFDAVELMLPVFFRTQGAYIIGRVRRGTATLPLVFSLRHPRQGIEIDAVLMNSDDVSIVFSYTRWYFHVDTQKPHEAVKFLKTILPLKRVAELYVSIGFNKHGKTELYRDLLRHMEMSDDHFEIAPGERGMIMIVFTLPSYDMVFKVIRDRFWGPKKTTRQDVMGRYRLVFEHDRAGRLVDALEFEHLCFERKRLSDALSEELFENAYQGVAIDGDLVWIKHLYVERRTTPLNIYLRQAPIQDARRTVIDYGYAIKDLAATNIFPGDILLKNFGVTRHGRVVFYDYDELGILTDYRFRQFPPSNTYEDELAAEPWYGIRHNDVFPEEFSTFLGLHGELRELFVQTHADIFDPRFWQSMQQRHLAGEFVDISPYPAGKRLRQDDQRPWCLELV